VRRENQRNPITGEIEQSGAFDVTGNIGEYAAGRGLTNASQEWSSIIRERLREMVPVVQVLSGREATAIFAKSVQIEDLFEKLEEEEDDVMASLN
jgi:hypothetical protein